MQAVSLEKIYIFRDGMDEIHVNGNGYFGHY